jgi:hypothetical protein
MPEVDNNSRMEIAHALSLSLSFSLALSLSLALSRALSLTHTKTLPTGPTSQMLLQPPNVVPTPHAGTSQQEPTFASCANPQLVS